MTRIALGVQYSGTGWHGWQSQPGRNTVQDTLEAALSSFADHPIRVTCAGRTDAGVHAIGQVVHFDSEARRDLQGWIRGVNALLPKSIAVTWSRAVDASFHARFSAVQRHYDYLLYNHPVRAPLWDGRAGWVHMPLDVERMRAAGQCLLGQHDFSAFRSAECQARSPVRQMDRFTVQQCGPLLVISLAANGFLHHMVRNLVGCLVYVGCGRQPVEWLAAVLAQRERRLAAPTFMAAGLHLTAVQYPASFGLPAAPHLAHVYPGLIAS